MSVIIKNFEMPRSCIDCKLAREFATSKGVKTYCLLGCGGLTGYMTVNYINSRHPQCPLTDAEDAATAARGEDEMRGVRTCPKCKTDTGQVIDSRLDENGWVRRRRQCPVCGRRWSSVEVPAEWIERKLKEEKTI